MGGCDWMMGEESEEENTPHTEITHTCFLRFMQKHGIAFGVKSPFIINSSGKAYLRPHGPRLSWGDFAQLSKLPQVSAMTFRHNMSNVLAAQKDATLAEMEEFINCHSKAT